MMHNSQYQFSLSSLLVVILLLGISFTPFCVAEHFYLAPWSDDLYLGGYAGLLIFGGVIGAVIGRGYKVKHGTAAVRGSIFGAISLLVVGYFIIQIVTCLIVFRGISNI